jgi:tetratricopeptide (TPR) repeat protein
MLLRASNAAVLASFMLLTACAQTKMVGTTELTSAQMQTSYRESEAAAQSLTAGRDIDALAQAERAIVDSPSNAWAHYARASALRSLGHAEAAVAAFHDAEVHFGTSDPRGKAISIYGRARALNDVGRCEEAKAAYGEFASFVRLSDPEAARMALAYAEDCRVPDTPIGDLAMTKMVTAMMDGRDKEALALAGDVGQAARESGWLDYNRAIVLARLSRTDDAVVAYRAAEQRFGTADPHGRSIAIYGRARALADAGRCPEATRAYQEYAALVRATQPQDADMALTFARACRRR